MKKARTFTLEEELIERLKFVSEKSDIPQARLVEKWIEKELVNMESKYLNQTK